MHRDPAELGPAAHGGQHPLDSVHALYPDLQEPAAGVPGAGASVYQYSTDGDAPATVEIRSGAQCCMQAASPTVIQSRVEGPGVEGTGSEGPGAREEESQGPGAMNSGPEKSGAHDSGDGRLRA